MKIRFHQTEQDQKAVKEAQKHVRQATARRWPFLRLIFLLIVVGIIAFVYFEMKRLNNVYAYGIASGEMENFYAPFDGTVNGMSIERGFRVSADDLLFEILPDQSDDLAEARKRVLDSIRVAREEAATDEEARRTHAVDMAQIEVDKLIDFHNAKRVRYARLIELRRLDAAIQSDVAAARNEMELASHNLKQARLDLELATRLDYATPFLIDEARMEETITAAIKSPMEFRASFDGIVLEVNEVNGSFVRAGRRIATVAATAGNWVDGYLPPQYMFEIQANREVLVYLAGNPEEPVKGVIRENSMAETKMPTILQDKMPTTRTAVYARIEVEDPDVLLPGGIVRIVLLGIESENAMMRIIRNAGRSIRDFVAGSKRETQPEEPDEEHPPRLTQPDE